MSPIKPQTVLDAEEIVKECLKLLEQKNIDYGDSWRRYGANGAFIRLSDKFFRLEHLYWNKKEPVVDTEKLEDTARDLINYAILFLVALQGK